MSTAAKATLASTVAGTIGIVWLVHRQQKLDKAVSQDPSLENGRWAMEDP